ncbi:MAG: hypothetical protein JF625_26200 [Inquilinus limosus]|uniref:Uncharacterized protein n=1 Tax=Inquilinus limosus TaxID=171674 RepID=A0A952FU30_9PROT|nr:hypothetical protein [Inquilinus limosus]
MVDGQVGDRGWLVSNILYLECNATHLFKSQSIHFDRHAAMQQNEITDTLGMAVSCAALGAGDPSPLHNAEAVLK